MELINQVTIWRAVLTGAALIREREHGTVEHLLVMPVTPFEIMTSKIWGITPRESMPEWVQIVMLAAPSTHFVTLAQGILYRGAGLDVVWKPFLALFAIGTVLFGYALARFRATIGTMV